MENGSKGFVTFKELRDEFGFGEVKMKSLLEKLIEAKKVEFTKVERKSAIGNKIKVTGYRALDPKSVTPSATKGLIRDLIEELEVNALGDNAQHASQFKADIESKKAKFENAATKQKYKAVLEEIESLEKRLNLALDIKQSSPQSYGTYHIKNSKKKSDSVATAFMIASDWHIEEKVDPKTINGLNEYNPDIAQKRSQNFFTNGLRLIEIERSGVEIDTLVIAILGDVINGYIHEEFIEDNYMSPTEAILKAQSFIVPGIDMMLKEGKFKKIIVPCSYGNHGRTTAKSRIATGYKNSFEWLMYHNLKQYYRNEPRVEFLVSDGYFNYVDVYGYVVRLHHGDHMKYSGGVGGIYVSVNKSIAQWNRSQRADLDVFGHWHQLIDGGNFICNGSLIGYNAFASMIKAPYEDPKQAFFLVDNKRGKTIVAPIHVEEPKIITKI